MQASSQPRLLRGLSLFTATMLVAGITIGSGVFKKIIPLAQTGLTEGWILLAWILAGIITMLSALNLSALSSLTEESGGIYEYLRLSFGTFFSFLYGWTDFAIIGCASVAALGFVFSQTIHSFFPLPNLFPQWERLSIAGAIYPFKDSGIKVVTIAAVALLTWVNYRGVKDSSFVNLIFTSAKVLGILFLAILALFYFSPPTTIAASSTPSLSGTSFFSAFFVALLSIFWAYDGWYDVSFLSGEVRNPKRNVPLAIIIGVSIIASLYVLANYAYTKVLPLPTLAVVSENEIGAAVVAQAIIGTAGKNLINLLIMLSAFGALNGVILAHSRIYFRMAQEGLFFSNAVKVHRTHRTPYFALLYTMIWSCLLAISGTFDALTDMIVFASFLFYGLLAVAVIKLKKKGKLKVRPVGYPFVQVIIILFSLVLIGNTVITQPKQSLMGFGLLLSGVPFYYYWKKKNRLSQERVDDES